MSIANRTPRLPALAKRCAAALLLTLVSVAPPALADGAIGEGTLHLHPSVMQAYAKFKSTYNPTYFAVSTNGLAYGYVYCPDQACMAGDNRAAAIRSCSQVQQLYAEEFRKNGAAGLKGECFIFANSSRILWQGTILDMGKEDWLEWFKTSGFLVVN